PAMGGLALLLVAAGSALVVRRGHARAAQLGWGLLAALSSLVATGILAAVTLLVLRLAYAVPYFFLALAWPAKVAFWVVPLVVGIPLASAFIGRAGRVGLWLSGFLFFGVLGAALGVLKAGLAYPFVVPALVAGVVAVAWGASRSRPADLVPRWVCLPPFLVAAVVWLPLGWLLYDGL